MTTDYPSIIQINKDNTFNYISKVDRCLLLKRNLKKKLKEVDFLYMKILPSTFFILFLLIFCSILFRYIPNFYFSFKFKELTMIKDSIKYFPEYFCDNYTITKILTICSQIFYLFMMVIFTSIIRQRISVPELIYQKCKNDVIILLSLTSVASILGITFFEEKTSFLTKVYTGLVDNILFISFLTSSIIICLLLFTILKKIDLYLPHTDRLNFYFKKILLFLMTCNYIQYISCLLIISYYQPIIMIEQKLSIIIMILKEVNSIFFILNYLMFILSIKEDFYLFVLKLETIPKLEDKFFDIEEN